VLFGVPTTLDVLARHPRFAQTSFASVRFVLAGGEPMPLELIRTYEARSVPVRQGFGMTEFGPNLFSLSAHESVRKMGSVGTPNPYVEVRLVDPAGNEVNAGAVGELYLRGPMATPGYWHNEAATRAAFHDGWFATGDAMRVDDEGFYFVAGRTKDMFISGGENVYPAEVERFVSSHPKVREVAVIGVPDATWGEVGKAFVVPMPGETLTSDEVLAFCRQGLAKYKTPKVVEVREALPKGDSGKILKRSLK
jgi:fatty-acyl-CoA synthase